MRERAPGLPEVKAAEMAALRTLGQIVDYLRDKSGAAPASAASVASAPAQPASSGPNAAELEALMLAIVAEKTGYPAEMLALTMELEADLGIDSIKRVEILSAMRERAPGLPEVKAAEMAALRTLGQIVDYLRGKSGGAVTTTTVAEAAKVAEAPAGPTIERSVLVSSPARPCGLSMSGLLGARKILVTDDGAGVALEVVRALAARGLDAEVASTVTGEPDVLIFLGGLRAVASVDEAVAVNHEAFHAAQAVAARFAASGGVLVTVQDTGGDFGLSGGDLTRAYLAGVSALARTAAVEWPSASVKAVDLERGGRSPAALAEALVEELFTGGAAREVGLHADGTRSTLRSVVRAVGAPVSAFDKSDVVLVSGGARGVTAASIVELARRGSPRVVLLGRTQLEDEPAACRGVSGDAELKRALMAQAQAAGQKLTPAELGARVARIVATREIRATVEAIRAAGSEVRYLAVDVQDGPGLAAALAEIRSAWGPITAVVHGAGVLADKKIADKTQEQFDRVWGTKVTGLRALLAATAGDPLRFIGLFSSVAARTGNLGQCDYAMANEVLNKVACALRHERSSLVVKAIGWGPWEGGMVTPSLKAHFDQMGVALLPLAEGARRFVDELLGSPDEVETVIGGALGEGALGAASSAKVSAEVTVGGRSHPYLGDHRVGGKPVVPVAMAIEWMSRAARAVRPEGAPLVLRDLKVLRGIKLEHFENGGDRLAVSCAPHGNGHPGDLAVELRGQGGVLHYSASVDARTAPSVMPERSPAPALGAWKDAPIYDGHLLFHGPSFQVIRSVDGVSREGITGSLTGARERGWAGEGFRIDPAAVDGALQFALLWAQSVLGGATLPMSVAAFESFVDGVAEGPIRCVVHGREVHASRAVCDVLLEDAGGHPIAALRGVETILRPDEPPAKRGVHAGLAS
jgi:NADP-dependent 3-hydroxy acid dehydrogenase YdfG/acyl carrier protein